MIQSPDVIKIYESDRAAVNHAVGFVFDSPHSGQNYPADFHHDCPRADLKHTEDNHIDELFDFAPSAVSAPFLTAQFPRCYVDPNRAVDDIDPVLFPDAPIDILTNKPLDSRAVYGYGVVRRLIYRGAKIYNQPLSWADAERRIEQYYTPYHAALRDLIHSARQRHEQVIHINCHSMPARAALTRQTGFGLWSRPVDICLGTLCGVSADNAILKQLELILKTKGYRVSLNDPYQGAEIIRRYGRPDLNVHSIQIEIAKPLYMNEKTLEKTSNFSTLKDDLCATFKEFHQTLLNLY